MLFSSKSDAARKLKARNPRTGKLDYTFTAPGAEALGEIVSSVRAAQPAWRDSGVQARAEVLGAWKAELEARSDALIAALAADTGRNAIAQQEAFGFLANIDRWRAEAPALLQTETRPSKFHADIELQTRTAPYPVVGVVSPWNFPLILSFIDAVPALLAGCGAVIKPSEVTPRFAEPLMEAVNAVPELANVLHVVPGDGETGAALIPLTDVVAFTGSVVTGRKVGEAAAKAFIPAFLELGGKDPSLVFHGADLDRATTALLRASVIATGQACQSIERIYVERPSFDAFVTALTEKAKATPLSHPDPNAGIVGPLIFEKQAEIIAAHLKDAVDKGAVIHCGGEVQTLGGGKWVAPTVVTNVSHDMRLLTEETFGPIMPVMPFDTADEAVALANDTAYGLSASVFAATDEAAIAIAERIDAGGISINDAGLTTMVHEIEKSGFKASGLGPSRMGPTGLTRFLRRKALYVNRGDVAPIAMATEGQ
ncbi:MAG: aldehyde dehydrogenase family protein [Pseudomonadota bacterium]